MSHSSVDIIIIGAGVAGLAAGCYAQMNGYRTQIFELHDQPGGLCTAWERKGYTFDGSQLQVSLGVNRDLSGEPHWATYLLNRPILIAGEERHEIGIKHYCFDPSLAPPGKSVITIMLPTAYDYWQRIYGRSLYHAEQIQESDLLIDQLEKFYPGIKANIEFVDVATPLSYERYTGNWQGSNCGWFLTKQTLPLMLRGIPKTLPGLKNFYMIGQWVEPGGSVPIVAMSGRNIVQQICQEDKRIFMATTP
jgi:phytoene dehydrogenase-like protein